MANITSLTGLVGKDQLSGVVSTLVSFIKTEDSGVTTGYKTLVGDVPNDKGGNARSVVKYIDDKIAGVGGDTTDLQNQIDSLSGTVGTKKTDDAAATGLFLYVDDAATAAVNKVVSGAPEAFDTLREIAEWIADDTNASGATAMAEAIAAIKTNLGDFQQATAITNSISTAETEAITSGKSYTDTVISGLDATVSGEAFGVNVQVVETDGKITGVNVSAPDFENTYDAKGAASAVQGTNCTNTVKDCVEAISGFTFMTSAELQEVTDLIA